MILNEFAHVFSKHIWERVQVLLAGAILSPAERTVTAALRAVGLSHEKHFPNYHRVLNRAIWSSLDASKVLLKLLVNTFALFGPIVFVLDDTIERRRGENIKAKGIHRDPVRSSHSHMVKASGLRWLSLMMLVPILCAGCVWALPFLTVLAPSERYYEKKVRKHKKLTDWARQMLFQLRKWLPKRKLVVVADKGKRLPTLEAVLANIQTTWQSLTIQEWYGEKQRQIEITSDTAVWYHSGMPPVPIRWVLIRDPKRSFNRKLCFVPIWILHQNRSSLGLCGAGR